MSEIITAFEYMRMGAEQRQQRLEGKEIIAGNYKVLSVGVTMSNRYYLHCVGLDEQTHGISHEEYRAKLGNAEQFEVSQFFHLEIVPAQETKQDV